MICSHNNRGRDGCFIVPQKADTHNNMNVELDDDKGQIHILEIRKSN